MVSLSEVQASNARIASTLPARLVAVFVGATSGIGETTLKQFAQHTKEPCVYFVGRSEEAGDRIRAECKNLNPEGEYNFIKADTSLIRNVDKICRDIKNKETSVNLLFLSSGVLIGRESKSTRTIASSTIDALANHYISHLREPRPRRQPVSLLSCPIHRRSLATTPAGSWVAPRRERLHGD